MTDARNPADRRLFIVVGSQRTGTTLLRDILNSNDEIAMVAEVMIPYPAPSHWNNFVPTLPQGCYPPETEQSGLLLLDRYFNFVRGRIRDHWTGGKKNHAFAIGVDIKCNQLRSVDPTRWPNSSPPFLLHHAEQRQIVLINTIRKNVMQCAISAMIATYRGYWHNYDGRIIDRPYEINVNECLNYARTLIEEQREFERFTTGCCVVACHYEDLVQTTALAGPDGDLSEHPGPLAEIATALGATCSFRFDGKLKKAINLPYSQVLSNHQALVAAIRSSEFCELADTIV